MVAVALHVIGLNMWSDRNDPAQIAAAGAPVPAKFGSSFSDLVSGVMQPVSATAVASHSVPDQLQPNTVTRTAMASDMANATAVTPFQTIVSPNTKTTPSVPITAALEALPDNAPTRSTRPVARPSDLKLPDPVSQTGNASQNAVAGAGNDHNQDTSSQSGSNAAAPAPAAQNNAAVTNYPGEVLRRIASVRRPRTNARGVAVVSFTIARNGNIAGVGILRSSGNRGLDQIAQRVVRTAAPFPPPPSGAKTEWQIEIAGR